MATKLSRPVSRETLGSYSVLYASGNKARPIVVTLRTMGGDDMLEFRAKGGRARWLLPVDTAFRYAVTREAFKEKMTKGKARAERKRINARSRRRSV